MEGSMAEFGRYVGDWEITDEALARDGSGWAPGNAAERAEVNGQKQKKAGQSPAFRYCTIVSCSSLPAGNS